MDVSSSAVTGALRLGVQVLAGQRRPVVEIYQQLHNEFDPPVSIEHRDSTNTKVVRTDQHRFQHIYLSLTLANIGGERAENISFEIKGNFRRNGAFKPLPSVLSKTVSHFPPGQTMFLMNIRENDLLLYEYEQRGGQTVGRPTAAKTETLTITTHYDGPKTWLNRLRRWPRRLRKLKQYSTEYVFDPSLLEELPTPRYNG